MREAFNAVTNAMAVQYCDALVQLSNIAILDIDESSLPKPIGDGFDPTSVAMHNLNMELCDVLVEQKLGRFFRQWQSMESSIRSLMIQASNDGSGLSTIYKPDKTRFTNRVEKFLPTIDPELCEQIAHLAKLRNDITHGAIIAFGRPRDGNLKSSTGARMEPHIVHHDMHATAFVSTIAPSEEKVMITPKANVSYSMKIHRGTYQQDRAHGIESGQHC